MEHFLHFLKIITLWHFSESPQIHGNLPEIDLTGKVSPKFMSTNADNVRFKLVCNVRVRVYSETLPVPGKT